MLVEMAVKSMETAEEATASMEMAPRALPHPGRVTEQRLLSPEIYLQRRRHCGTVLGKMLIILGCSVRWLYIGEEAASEVGQAHLTIRPRGPRGAPPYGEAALWPPLRLSFGPRPSSRKIRSFGLCFVQFRGYFLCSFSETQKLQKIGNWHCGISLVGYFWKTHKNALKCNKTQSKWCINKHGASKIIDTFETYQPAATWNLHTTQLSTLPQLTMRSSSSPVCCKQRIKRIEW
jgi:hypothetical protein